MYVMGALGPAIGYVMGGMILRLYVEVGVDGLTEDDDRFIGAWFVD